MEQKLKKGAWGEKDFSKKYRDYPFTDYECDKKFWEKMVKTEKVKYLIIGEEICPKTKKTHWQGFLYFMNPRSWSAVRKLLAPRHVEPAGGSVEANTKYCSKDGKIIMEYGDKPVQGKRTDLSRLKEMIINGDSSKDIFEEMPGNFVRYNRGIECAMSLYQEKRNWEMDVRIYWGNPGCGKTRSAMDEFGSDNVYMKPKNKWWDGYNGEHCVVIDDFDPNDCENWSLSQYLTLLDRYPMTVERKGSSVQFRSKVIIFTSNYDPETWFREKRNRSAFFRRVKEIRHIPGGLAPCNERRTRFNSGSSCGTEVMG